LIFIAVEEILVASALFVAAGTTEFNNNNPTSARLGGLPRHDLLGRTNSLQLVGVWGGSARSTYA
jgi:hypothetical protein